LPGDPSTSASGPRSQSYDVAVIGSGLGGLSAAALLAKSGRSVIVVEQGSQPGGYAQAFKRGPYTFDPAIHRTLQGHDGGIPDALLKYLGVRERVELKPSDQNYLAAFPDFTIDVPVGFDRLIESHCEHFPAAADGIRRFFETCTTLHRENHEMPPQLGLSGLDEAARRAPTLFKYLRATVADVLDEFVDDERAKAACSVIWPHIGVPPSEVSFVTYALTMVMYSEGVYYCMGSFQSLVDAFVHALQSHGGELLLDTEVTRVLVEDGRATGIELAGESRIAAPIVVSNADARRTLEDMVGADALPPRMLKRLRRMKPSCSAFLVTGATSLPLEDSDLGLEVFLPLGLDHEEAWQKVQQGSPDGMWGAFPTLDDPSLAPPGEHAFTLTALAPYDVGQPWADLADAYAAQMLEAFERLLPGLGDSITFMETATPETLERYCRNQGGAIYGWANTPNQSGGKRSPHRTPVDGLLLSGHWSQPGSSSLRVMISGLHTAQLALMGAGFPPLDFEHPEMPPPG
jgi:prolycopene isomerase